MISLNVSFSVQNCVQCVQDIQRTCDTRGSENREQTVVLTNLISVDSNYSIFNEKKILHNNQFSELNKETTQLKTVRIEKR